jgi:UDP-glucuronate 4-epimerase
MFMAVLVTGGAGFVGSRLADRLLKMGQEVVILDNFNDYYDTSLKRANIAALDGGARVVEGDVRDEALVARLFDEYGITRVAHLAAMAGVRYSAEQGRLYADVNTGGSVTLMDAARKRSVEVFVQASTSSVYGNTERIPFVEDDSPDFPLAPYPASKRAAELFAHSYHHLFGLNVTVLRFFNVYGPHGRPDMMPIKVIDAMLSDQPIQVYDGGDLKRDWTYIDDTVDGIVAALERPLGYKIINLGYGAPVSLTEFIEVYEELIGKTAIQNYVPAPLTEPHITYCDNTRARQLLDFNPKIALPDGLARTWEWYKEHHRVK